MVILLERKFGPRHGEEIHRVGWSKTKDGVSWNSDLWEKNSRQPAHVNTLCIFLQPPFFSQNASLHQLLQHLLAPWSLGYHPPEPLFREGGGWGNAVWKLISMKTAEKVKSKRVPSLSSKQSFHFYPTISSQTVGNSPGGKIVNEKGQFEESMVVLPIIPALSEAETGGSQVRAWPDWLKKALSQNKRIRGGCRYSSVERPSTASIPSTKEKN